MQERLNTTLGQQ